MGYQTELTYPWRAIRQVTEPAPSSATRDTRPVAYVLHEFPQLSETFVENEIRAVGALGVEIWAYSVYRPAPELRGPSTFDPERLKYRPGNSVLALHFFCWALRRPVATARNVASALRLRSQTMLRGAWSSGWVASGLRRHDVRHVHAHFALDAACTALAAAALVGLPCTFTLHAHELYLRTRGLCARCRRADRVVTVCQYNIDQLRARCPELGPERIELVYCGVDPAQFAFTERRPHGGPVRLLSVGRLVGTKGFAELVRAVAILRAGGHAVTCEIIGQGPLRDQLEALVAELDLGDVVALVGSLLPIQVAERMAEADLFVLACRVDADGNRDSMPVVVKEAMATGLPVVTTRAVGMPEMVDEVVGRLADPEDPASLAKAIEEVIVLPDEERLTMGRNARDRVETAFNVHTEAAKLVQLFDRLDCP
jgi:glycosyltransferase involved in cell wall biosynthesis